MTYTNDRETYNETKDHGSLAQEIARAIAESIAEDRIIYLDYSDAARDALSAECEGDAETDDVHEFWGVDVDGNEWRVHLS